MSGPTGFNQTIDGDLAGIFTIRAPDSLNSCDITNFGARILALNVSDQEGKLQDIVLGYPNLKDYQQEPEEFMGATIGRCANRIAAGLFVLDGKTQVLQTNEDHNTLNGGPGGLHNRLWTVIKKSSRMLVLTYFSRDEEEGFPGNLNIELIYEWKDAQTLKLTYHATTDKPTLVNLSNNSYFNLNGVGNGSILDHELWLNADHYTEIDSRIIPTGRLCPVSGSDFDFRSPRIIGKGMEHHEEQLNLAGGYDHNFVLGAGNPALKLSSIKTGICLEISTDRPGMQVNTANHLNGSIPGKSGVPYRNHNGIVLSPQGFPDAIHHPQFPSVILKPGEVYFSVSEYRFSC